MAQVVAGQNAGRMLALPECMHNENDAGYDDRAVLAEASVGLNLNPHPLTAEGAAPKCRASREVVRAARCQSPVARCSVGMAGTAAVGWRNFFVAV